MSNKKRKDARWIFSSPPLSAAVFKLSYTRMNGNWVAARDKKVLARWAHKSDAYHVHGAAKEAAGEAAGEARGMGFPPVLLLDAPSGISMGGQSVKRECTGEICTKTVIGLLSNEWTGSRSRRPHAVQGVQESRSRRGRSWRNVR